MKYKKEKKIEYKFLKSLYDESFTSLHPTVSSISLGEYLVRNKGIKLVQSLSAKRLSNPSYKILDFHKDLSAAILQQTLGALDPDQSCPAFWD